jgi:hypothetical protein
MSLFTGDASALQYSQPHLFVRSLPHFSPISGGVWADRSILHLSSPASSLFLFVRRFRELVQGWIACREESRSARSS